MTDDTRSRLLEALTETDRQAHAPTEVRRVTLAKLRDYSRGEQFGQRFEYWRGRLPKNRDDYSEVRKLAVMDDQLQPALKRFVSATLGRDPEWTLRMGESDVTSAILEDPQAEGDRGLAQRLQDLERAGTTWHKDADLHNTLRDAMLALLWGGRSSLRVYIPDAYRDEARQGRFPTLEDALELIHVQAVSPLDGGPVLDEHGRTIGHYYRYTRMDGQVSQQMVEVHTPEEIEHYRVQANQLTSVGEAYPNPLYDPTRRRRPHYLMHTLDREDGPILTPSLLDAQDALNIELTNARRNSDMGGFRSIVTLNADGPVDEAGEPAEWTLSPDIVAELRGIPLTVDQQGQATAVANPGVEVIEPVNPEVFLKGADGWRAMILHGLDQSHILSKFQAVSGESKRESRDDFDKRVTQESQPVADALAWAIPTVLRLAAWMTAREDPAKLADLSCDPRLYLDVSRGNLEVFREQVAARRDRLVSLETVIESNPAVSDAQAEIKRLEAEEAAAAPGAVGEGGEGGDVGDDVRQRADALGVLIRAGVEAKSAAQLVGLQAAEFTGAIPVSLRVPEEEARRLEGGSGPPANGPPGGDA